MDYSEEYKSLQEEKKRLELELVREKQLAFVTGLFQEDVTIRALLESLVQGVILVDQYRNILFVNKPAEQMFGYPSLEIVGKPHDILIPIRLRKIHEEHMTNYFKSPKIRPMGIGLELSGLRKDGSEFPVEISLSFVNTKNGLLVISMISDITQRKEIERSLQKHSEELASMNEELESFSYSVSHDLKTPVRTLIGFSELLLGDYADKHGEEEVEYLERIRNGAMRMSELIDDMLELSKVSRQEMIRKETNMSEIAENIISDLHSAEPDRKVKVSIQQNLNATVDKKLIKFVLTNLIGNAWKFTSKTENPHIEFGELQINGQPSYYVKDNGVGFEMRFKDRLFVPFQRLHSEKEFPGTGIGLAIVDRVIKRHGGKIWAESEVGKGATFYFTINSSKQ